MDANRININLEQNPIIKPNRVNPAVKTVQPGSSFGETLARASGAAAIESETPGLRFSKHAATRLNSREVDLSPEQLKRVENGVSAALNKGVSDSLVLVDGYALVVNTKSKTVVTAMQHGQNGGVFTNINGAVIV
jgi:flagellar operon protein